MENVFWTGLSISILVAVIAVYLVLYLFKWANGWKLIWQGFLVNPVSIISVIFSVFLTFILIVEKFRLGFRSGFIIMAIIGVLTSVLFTIGVLVLLKRFGKSSATPPRILPLSLLIGILTFAILASGTIITMKVEEYYNPPSLQTGE